MKKSTKWAVGTIVMILIFGAGILAYLYMDRKIPSTKDASQHTADRAAPQARDGKGGFGGAQKTPGQGEPDQGQALVRKKIAPPHPERSSTAGDARSKSEYDLVTEEMKQFCRYLDERSYIEDYRLTDGTLNRGIEMIEKLSERRPIVSGETQNMSTLTSNLYHLYRALGRKNTNLILDVFIFERNKVEEAMDLIYRWLLMDMERSDPATKISLEAFYDYGAFFLATLGGKSYLARRDSKIRILTTYYSILIVDKAESLKQNRYGIDIRPHIQMAVDDIKNYQNLEYADWYLKRLEEIRERING